ncbi:MAG TPA: hypothetical protein VFZ91_03970 [Allosphingosinicella sp.]
MFHDVVAVERTELIVPLGKVGEMPLRGFANMVEFGGTGPVADRQILEGKPILVPIIPAQALEGIEHGLDQDTRPSRIADSEIVNGVAMLPVVGAYLHEEDLA